MRHALLAGIAAGIVFAAIWTLGEWLRGDMRELLLDHLHGASSRTRAYYRADELDRVLGEHLKGRQNHQKLLWMLLNLEIWHRTYRPG